MRENENRRGEENSVIAGRNAVLEALNAGVELDKLFVADRQQTGSINKIVALARQRGVVVKQVSDQKLSAICGGEYHQGVVATASCAHYATVEELLEAASQKGEPPFLILADGVEDPHNLGALIRTAEAAGAHGLIIPKRRSASLSAIVQKTSAGAVNHLPVARVANLAAVMDRLKEEGLWFYAADMGGSPWCEQDYSGPCGLVIGSEGEGVSRLVLEKCDFRVSLPMLGKVTSLNASVAGGILMYEIARQRLHLKAM
jgi:23S rRNA (guanosine2251-2'-O)-methyltransferase